MPINPKLIDAYHLYRGRKYELAHKLKIHPSTLSQLILGISPVCDGDERLIRIGAMLGFKQDEVFVNVG